MKTNSVLVLQKKLINGIKKNPIKLVLIGFLLLNCFGFCYKRMWFLSNEERIEIAVQKALNFYEGSNSWGKTDAIINEDDFHKTHYEQLPYKNKEDFFAQNPNCCEVSRNIKVSEGRLSVGIYGCLSGVSPYFVSGNFKVQFRVDDQIKTGYSRFAYYISSCGTLYYLYD